MLTDANKRCGCGAGHLTFGSCLRSKNLKVDTAREGRSAWDSELDAYRDARRQGVQPAGTKMPQIREAMALSEVVGKAFDATDGSFS